MSESKRGILYVVWGDRSERVLHRSIESVRRLYRELPIHVVRGTEQTGFSQKTRMGALTPFQTTLFLDADAVVMGNLDFGFEQAEQFGLACTICECPWLRRYGPEQGDRTEYNTGVIFFTSAAAPVMSAWERLATTTPAKSVWLTTDGTRRGMAFEDQASFAQAIIETRWNPYVLPANWNLRPEFQRRVFAPVKIWHDYGDPPPSLLAVSQACESGQRPVTLVDLVPQLKDGGVAK